MNAKARIFGFAALILQLVVIGVPAFSQRTTASLSGTVKDASGAVVPGVVVEVANEETAQVLSATTNEVGEFSLSFVPAGQFQIKVEMPGFKPFQQAVQFTAGQQVRF